MIIRPGKFCVIKVFPEHEKSIIGLYDESELFRELCKSYQKCTEALTHWNASNLEEAPARRAEYTALLREIEADIVQEIKDIRKPDSSPNQQEKASNKQNLGGD